MTADQLRHSRVSMTQDTYLGRRAANVGKLAALEAHDPDRMPDLGEHEGRSDAFVP
jgi:hypothetical protein